MRKYTVLLFCLFCAACSYRLVRHGRVETGEFQKMQKAVAHLRGLSFVTPVPVKVLTSESAASRLREELEHEYPAQQLDHLGKIYAALGLLPADINLHDTLLRLYSSQVAGFYDPREKTLYLVEGARPDGFVLQALQLLLRRDLVGEVLLSHELTHALQDQHFSLEDRLHGVEEGDRALAERAVVEGDATLASFAYLLGGLKKDRLWDLAQRVQEIPGQMARQYPDLPEAVRGPLIFQYTAGVNFVAWAYQKKAWGGVNDLLSSPPVSTEQILHPEKFYLRPDYPVTPIASGFSALTDTEWKLLHEETLGELMVHIWAKRFLAQQDADLVASGWDGDRLLAFQKKDLIGLIWMTAWDTPQDAEEFFRAAAKILSPLPVTKSSTLLLSPAGEHLLEMRKEKVLFLQGLPVPDIESLAGKIWEETTWRQEGPWLPLDIAAGSPGGHGGALDNSSTDTPPGP